MPDFDLSITIASWNTAHDLFLCLESLEKVRNEVNFEVIVVDNNSQDESPDMVEQQFPWVTLYRRDRNYGFTGAHNFALLHKNGRHTLLLNSDTIVHANALKILVDHLETHLEVGFVGPKLLNPDGSLQLSCRRFPNPVAALFRGSLFGKPFPNNKWLRDYLMTDWDHNATREVDWVSGAAFVISEACYAKIGAMDDKFYMFCEDVDWCWRAWDAGFKVVYVPQAEITHAIGRSTDKTPNRMIGRFHRSMLYFYTKNMVPKMHPLVRPLATAFAASALGVRAVILIIKNRIRKLRTST